MGLGVKIEKKSRHPAHTAQDDTLLSSQASRNNWSGQLTGQWRMAPEPSYG